jgi:hypothetical protein
MTARWPRLIGTSGISHSRGDLKDVFAGDSYSGGDN